MARYAFTAMVAASCLLRAAQTGVEEYHRVFPGARGFGVLTPAGNNGRIVRVTNLNGEGPGSLREALSGRGPRLVVFEVGGVIDLQTKAITIAEPYLTVAGQTAPSPGITVIKGSILIRTHDVLIRHLRFRLGDAGRPKAGGWETEMTTWGADAYNIVIDHCSVSWGVQSNLSVAGPQFEGPMGTSHNITFSNSIVAEGLSNSAGTRAMGSLVNDGCTNVAMIGNLFASNDRGNPYFKANTSGVLLNNLVYNPGSGAIQMDWLASEWIGHPAPHNPRVSVVGNVLYYGPSTNEGLALVSRKGDAYLADNLAFDRSSTPAAISAGLIEVLAERTLWPRRLMPLPAARVQAWVLQHAGARPRDRDDVDKRIVSEVAERKGRIISSQEEVGGYPRPAPARRRLVIPPEDLDEWLEKMAAEVE